jgi:hypothetical protein
MARFNDDDVRCRTDGSRPTAHASVKSRSARHGTPDAIDRVDSLSRLLEHRNIWLTGERGATEPGTGKPDSEKVNLMLYTIAVVLLILWLLGLVTSYTLGGFIHILLVVALVMILLNIISGRRAL